jgi:hypothetical protein
MERLAVGVVFTLFIVLLMWGAERILLWRVKRKYNDNWFNTVANDHNYLKRQSSVNKIYNDVKGVEK